MSSSASSRCYQSAGPTLLDGSGPVTRRVSVRNGATAGEDESHNQPTSLLYHFRAGCEFELFQGDYSFAGLAQDQTATLGGIPFILADTPSAPQSLTDVGEDQEEPLPVEKGIETVVALTSRRVGENGSHEAADVSLEVKYHPDSNAGDFVELFHAAFQDSPHDIVTPRGTDST